MSAYALAYKSAPRPLPPGCAGAGSPGQGSCPWAPQLAERGWVPSKRSTMARRPRCGQGMERQSIDTGSIYFSIWQPPPRQHLKQMMECARCLVSELGLVKSRLGGAIRQRRYWFGSKGGPRHVDGCGSQRKTSSPSTAESTSPACLRRFENLDASRIGGLGITAAGARSPAGISAAKVRNLKTADIERSFSRRWGTAPCFSIAAKPCYPMCLHTAESCLQHAQAREKR